MELNDIKVSYLVLSMYYDPFPMNFQMLRKINKKKANYEEKFIRELFR